ncbi:MAG: ferredoxin [Lachnospiraceae bacterium]
MKAYVDRDGCISCGLCASTCPEVFEMDEEDLSKVICDPVPEEARDSAVAAQEACPVSVITVEE